MEDILIISNFFKIVKGFDETILLLIVSLPVGFSLYIFFSIGSLSKNLVLAIKNGKTTGREDIRHLESSVVADNLIKIYESLI